MKVGEWGLVLLLTLHMFFGLRLLALELLPWRSPRDARVAWIGWGFAVSMATGLVFIAGVI
jgi:fumarate reductase subunit D